jgi:hypothetical protein
MGCGRSAAIRREYARRSEGEHAHGRTADCYVRSRAVVVGRMLGNGRQREPLLAPDPTSHRLTWVSSPADLTGKASTRSNAAGKSPSKHSSTARNLGIFT